jgi:hypothetical protein
MAHMSFGKYTLYSAFTNTANDNMSALGLAMLFGNKDKDNRTHFWKFIKTQPVITSPIKQFIPTSTRDL